MSDQNHAETISSLTLEAVAAQHKPFIIDGPNDRKFSAVPSGDDRWHFAEILPLENERAPLPPKVTVQHPRLQDVASLIAYVNRFKNTNSLLFADISTNTVLAIIDYHEAPAEGEGERKVTANFRNHQASLLLPHSLEWGIWKDVDGRLMTHADFANFLEENAPDVLPLGIMKDMGGNQVEDAPTTLFELVRELQVKSTFSAASAIRNGDYVEVEMQKGDDVSTKRNVALPLSIDLSIPVYFGEAKIEMQALIRRRVDSGSLKLGVKLVRPEQHRQDEFKRIVDAIEQDVALATHYGKPA